MTIASLAEVKARLSAYVESSKKGPIVVTRNGKPAAVLISVSDGEELESILLACSPRFQRLLERSNRQIDKGKGLSHAEFWRRVREQK